MAEDEIVKWLVTTGGPLGALTGYVIWQNIRIQKELLQVVKDNTTAITKLTTIIEGEHDKE